MKVLIIGEKNWHGRWVESTIEAFQKIADTDSYFYKDQSRAFWVRVRNLLCENKFFESIYKNIFYNPKDLIEKVKRNKYDLVLILKGGDLPESILKELKKHVPNLANWWVDNPLTKYGNEKLLQYYNYFFVFDSYYIPALQKLGIKNVHWLACAYNSKIFTSNNSLLEFKTDLAFVARYFPPREQLFINFQDKNLDISIWGPGWKDKAILKEFFERYPNSHKGNMLSNQDAANLYKSAKINLNLNHDQTKLDGINQRMLEICACGGFQICDYREGFASIFIDKKEIVYFKDPKEIPELVDYYLKNEEERMKIAKAGMEKASLEHSYEARAKRVLQVIQTES